MPQSITGKVPPDALQGFHPTTQGLGPTCHTNRPETRGGRTAAHEACNYPAGKRSLILAESSDRKGGPPRQKRTTSPRLYTLSASSCRLTRNGRSQTTAREPGNCPAVISVPPFSLKPAGKRADRHAGGVQPHHGCAPFRLHRIRWVSMKARARKSCNQRNGYCVQGNHTATRANAASSRLRNQCHDSRQPCA